MIWRRSDEVVLFRFHWMATWGCQRCSGSVATGWCLCLCLNGLHYSNYHWFSSQLMQLKLISVAAFETQTRTKRGKKNTVLKQKVDFLLWGVKTMAKDCISAHIMIPSTSFRSEPEVSMKGSESPHSGGYCSALNNSGDSLLCKCFSWLCIGSQRSLETAVGVHIAGAVCPSHCSYFDLFPLIG